MTDVRTAPAARRALIVEDDQAIRELVRLHLTVAKFDVTDIGDGGRALEVARSTPFDLIILDVMLPDVDGITLCRILRAEGLNRDASIMMLTARTSESEKVLGLESGADDYMLKPFSVRELVARANAVLRRTHRGNGHRDCSMCRLVRSRDITIDPARRQAVVRGDAIELTRQEFDLLYLLASNPGIVFSRAALLAKVWPGDTCVTERTVDSVVSRVRRKIERECEDPELVLTAWGIGYKFADVE